MARSDLHLGSAALRRACPSAFPVSLVWQGAAERGWLGYAICIRASSSHEEQLLPIEATHARRILSNQNAA
jgi:hypothetical protein